MIYKIILPLRSLSEREFFSIVQKNRSVELKLLFRKVPKKQVYQILKRLELLQNYFQKNILTRRAEFSKITNLPIVIINFNAHIEFKVLSENECVAIISCI